jgi:hypothetical protein
MTAHIGTHCFAEQRSSAAAPVQISNFKFQISNVQIFLGSNRPN